MPLKKHLFTGWLLLTSATVSAADPIAGTLFEKVAAEKGLDPVLLYSVAMAESGFKPTGSSQPKPWPWTIAHKDGAFFGNTRTDAERELNRLAGQDIQSIDIGLMQINTVWHAKNRSNRALLDPETNLKLGADILKNALKSAHGNWLIGIGRYNSWTNKETQAKYAVRVLKIYRTLKEN